MIKICDETLISMHCRQGDDVTGFEKKHNRSYRRYKETGKPKCIINHWLRDGDREFPVDSLSHCLRLNFCFSDEMLLHISRPIRWDSDHVVAFGDETKTVMKEVLSKR